MPDLPTTFSKGRRLAHSPTTSACLDAPSRESEQCAAPKPHSMVICRPVDVFCMATVWKDSPSQAMDSG